LLSLLADGEFHSGQELEDVMGVSRTALWKQLHRLEELGLAAESSKSRGYRIAGGVDLLDQGSILGGLSAAGRALLAELDLQSQIDSTNAEAMRRAESGAGAGLACVAEQQTAGRGRRGRKWISPFASNIYLSLVWEFEGGAAALEGLSLAVGVAVADALASCGVPDLELKWPNDIMHGGRKLGGILIEMAGDPAGNCQVVVGVGLNVRMPNKAAAEIDQQWTDIASLTGQFPGRNSLLAAVLDALLVLMPRFAQEGFEPWRERWVNRDAFAGKPVIVHSGPREIAGTVVGINETGALMLDVGGTVQAINGGEVSLRPSA
jgi:BirA family biotin operon repressor/biotin-[acetyl-CoA-carboxylase] ligase